MRSRVATTFLALFVIAAIVSCAEQQADATITVSPSEVSVAPGATVAFSAQVVNASLEDVVWSATCGSFQAQSNPTIYTAPSAAGTCQVVATAQGGGGPSAIAVVIVEPAVSVTVDPPEAEVVAGGTVTFTASVEHADDTGLTWTTTCGTVDDSGRTVTYRAPASPDSCLVTATSVQDSNASGTAVVTVVAPPQEGDTSVNVTVVGPGQVVQDAFVCTGACTWVGDGGEPVTLQAIPDTGSVLVAWGGVCPVLDEDCTRTFEDGDDVTVTFAPNAVRLDLTGDGEGQFQVSGGDVNATCDGDCGVAVDTPLQLAIVYEAAGTSGTELGAWSGACASATLADYCLVTASGATNVGKTWLHPPVAAPDDYTIRIDTTLTVPNDDAPGVLANDSDSVGDPLTASLVDDVSNGMLTLLPDGGFEYQPDAGFTGEDGFRYRVQDAFGNTDEANVTIYVSDLAVVASHDR